MEYKFSGLMAPVFTPFKFSLELDLDKIKTYAEFLKEKGIMGVLVNGTTGEGISMTVDERKAVVEEWMKISQVTGQVVMCQVGGGCLKDVCALATHAERIGVSAILCLPDLFFRPTSAAQLVDYLAFVGEAAPNTPLLYYHIPMFTGVNIDMAEFLELGALMLPTLAGIKYTHTDLDQGVRCLHVKQGAFKVFLGADQVLAGACVLGFDSVIATTLNMFPQILQNIIYSLRNGEVQKAGKLQKLLTDNISNITCHGSWVTSMKAAMKIVTNIDLGPPRPPLTPLTNEQLLQMVKCLT